VSTPKTYVLLSISVELVMFKDWNLKDVLFAAERMGMWYNPRPMSWVSNHKLRQMPYRPGPKSKVVMK
jgi:hypothetical protein